MFRLALGSTPLDVVSVLLKEPLVSVIDGLAVGGRWWIVAFVDAQLDGTRVHDPRLWAIAIGTLLVVSLTTAGIPVVRAARVNPVDTLRALQSVSTGLIEPSVSEPS